MVRLASKTLTDLAIAMLIGEGEFDLFTKEITLTTPYDRKKSLYLSEVIKNESLVDYVNINPKKEQFTILQHPVLHPLMDQWYKGNSKVFSFVLDPNLISLKSIVLCINLFGERKLESISIPTNVDKDHIKTLCYCIEQNIHVPVIPGGNHIKITNIPTFIGGCIGETSTIHSAELINFLTEKEKKKLTEGEV